MAVAEGVALFCLADLVDSSGDGLGVGVAIAIGVDVACIVASGEGLTTAGTLYLPRNQTKKAARRTIINIITMMVIFRLKLIPPFRQIDYKQLSIIIILSYFEKRQDNFLKYG